MGFKAAGPCPRNQCCRLLVPLFVWTQIPILLPWITHSASSARPASSAWPAATRSAATRKQGLRPLAFRGLETRKVMGGFHHADTASESVKSNSRDPRQLPSRLALNADTIVDRAKNAAVKPAGTSQNRLAPRKTGWHWHPAKPLGGGPRPEQPNHQAPAKPVEAAATSGARGCTGGSEGGSWRGGAWSAPVPASA
jgi:hypothetical protein